MRNFATSLIFAVSSCIFLRISSLSAESTGDTQLVLGLKELFARTEKNAALQKDFNAMHSLASAKLHEAQSLKWLPSIDMKVIGGVIPDATVNPNNVNDYHSKDFENDFSFAGLGPFWRVQVEAVQPLFTFGKISNAIEAAQGGKNLAAQEKNKKLSEVKLMVKKAYYTLQLSNDSLAILKDVEQKLSEANEKVEELLIKNADNVSEIDRLKIRVFTADVKNRKLDADRANRLSRSALAELAGLPSEWTLEESSLTAEKPNNLKKDALVQSALKTNPELAQLTQYAEMKEAEYRANRGNLFPTFFVAGNLEYAGAPGRTDISNPYLNDPFNTFGVGVVLGLKQDLSIHRTLFKLDSLKAEVDRLQAQKLQLQTKVKLDAEKAFEEAFSALQAMQINEEGFRAARSWLTSSGLSFNLGTSETKDILESFAAYFKARVDLLRSVYNLNIALADLTNITGVEVLERLQ